METKKIADGTHGANGAIPDAVRVQMAGRIWDVKPIQRTKKGRWVVNFRVRVDEPVEGGVVTVMVDCTAWDEAAHSARRLGCLEPGKHVAVLGAMRNDIWRSGGGTYKRDYVDVIKIRTLAQ